MPRAGPSPSNCTAASTGSSGSDKICARTDGFANSVRKSASDNDAASEIKVGRLANG